MEFQFKKHKNSLIRIGGIVLLLVIFFLIPTFAHAQYEYGNPITNFIGDAVAGGVKAVGGAISSGVGSAITGIGAGVVTSASFVINYILAYIAAALLSFSAMLVSFAIQLNATVLFKENVAVHLGWQIIRDVANLGFVLLMVIMAIGTILRFESYGFKRLFPKFVAAAILINFSFTIAGVFVDFSQTLTNFFFDKLGTVSSIGESLAGAFSIQRFGLAFTGIDSVGEGVGVFGAVVLTQTTALAFTITFTLMGVVTLLGFGVMLLLRYLWITFLVIVAPIVWLFWAFPPLSHHFSKWWNKFIQWIFFAPASAFFIYLAFATIKQLSISPILIPEGASYFAGSLQVIAQQGAQMIVVVGILLGGLIMAQTIGIKGASTALGIAKFVGNKARGTLWNLTKRGVSAPLRAKKEGDDQTRAEKIQTWAAKQSGPMRFAAGLLARGTTGVATAGGESAVKEKEKEVAGMALPNAKAALLTASGARKIALLKRLIKEGALSDIDMKTYLTPQTKGLFEKFGQGKSFGDLQKGFPMSVEAMSAFEDGNIPMFKEELDKVIRGLTKEDAGKSSIKEWFSDKPKFGLEQHEVNATMPLVAASLARTNYAVVPSILHKLSGETLDRFIDVYQDALDSELVRANTLPAADPDKARLIRHLDKAKDAFRNTLAAHGSTAFVPPPEGGPAPAPPAAAPPPAPAP